MGVVVPVVYTVTYLYPIDRESDLKSKIRMNSSISVTLLLRISVDCVPLPFYLTCWAPFS